MTFLKFIKISKKKPDKSMIIPFCLAGFVIIWLMLGWMYYNGK